MLDKNDQFVISNPLSVAEVAGDDVFLKTQDNLMFKVPVSVFPDKNVLNGRVVLNIGNSSKDYLINQRHRNLEDLIN